MATSPSQTWICSVCGYVHHGAEPPDYCPVCGATKDMFEPYTEAPKAQAAAAPMQWRCLNCGYIHEGAEPPAYCPVCGATADRFEPYTPAAPVSHPTGVAQKIVIIGAGIAGLAAAEAIRKSAPQDEILLISKEPDLPYYRLNLTRYLAGEVTAEQLVLHPETWYQEQQITLQRQTELRTINLAQKQLTLSDGNQATYDKLILTVGSHPFVPPLPGVNREQVMALCTKTDADAILAAAQAGAKCVCIGGGLLGLETAGALARRGVDVTLLEGHGWLLPRQLNQHAGDLLERYVIAQGITLRKHAQTQELVGDERVRGVLLKDGATLPADLVVITTGVRSNSYLARLAGLEVNQGVVVNNHLQTSHPDVFAAGDVAEHRGVTYGIWGPSQFQGTMAGMNVAGEAAEFVGLPRSNMLKVLGYDLFSIGKILPEDASYEVIDAERDGRYFYFVFRDQYLIGAILLGDTRLSAGVKNMVEKHHDCSPVLQKRPGVDDILDFVESV